MCVLMILHHGPIFLKVLPNEEAAVKKYEQIKKLIGGEKLLQATILGDFKDGKELEQDDGN